jgi:hypothetical protein
MTNRIVYCSNKVWRYCIIALTLFFFFLNSISAQRPSPSFGLGFQAGDPTGLSLQFYKDRGVTTDILLAYDLNDFFFINIHGLWNVHLDRSGHFHFFYGPGGFIGIRDNKPEGVRDDVVAGISGNFGLNFVINRVEFFGQATPRFALTPGTRFEMGGGVGMRFFF